MSHRPGRTQPEDIVRNLERHELESLILAQLEAENVALANAIITRFGSANGKGEWSSLVRNCRENRCANRHGMVDDAYGLTCDMAELRKQAAGF